MAARWRRCTAGGGRLLSRNFLLDWRFGDNLRISPLKHKREWSFPLKTKGLFCKPRSRSLQMNANRHQVFLNGAASVYNFQEIAKVRARAIGIFLILHDQDAAPPSLPRLSAAKPGASGGAAASPGWSSRFDVRRICKGSFGVTLFGVTFLGSRFGSFCKNPQKYETRTRVRACTSLTGGRGRPMGTRLDLATLGRLRWTVSARPAASRSWTSLATATGWTRTKRPSPADR